MEKLEKLNANNNHRNNVQRTNTKCPIKQYKIYIPFNRIVE